jgi:hypothetical protein
MSYGNCLKEVINVIEKELHLHPESLVSALGPK